jgi:hypothetical protein
MICYVSDLPHFIVSPPVYEAFERAIFGDYKSPWIPVGSSRKLHNLTSGRQRKKCGKDIRAEISILVISTDPSESIHMRGGQVVLEGSYQLFVNSILNSSCGQLKEKQTYVKKCIISLAVNKLRLCIGRRHLAMSLFELGCRLILLRPNLLFVWK